MNNQIHNSENLIPADKLTDKELLTELLSYTSCKDPEKLSQILFERFASIGAIAASDKHLLQSIPELTEDALIMIKLIPVFSARTNTIRRNGVKLNTAEKAKDFFRSVLENQLAENFTAVAVNDKFAVKSIMNCVSGTAAGVVSSCREIVSFALNCGTEKLFIAHSHTINSLKPSAEDIVATRSLMTALRPLNIVLIDHIITNDSGAVSMREMLDIDLFDKEPNCGYIYEPAAKYLQKIPDTL